MNVGGRLRAAGQGASASESPARAGSYLGADAAAATHTAGAGADRLRGQLRGAVHEGLDLDEDLSVHVLHDAHLLSLGFSRLGPAPYEFILIVLIVAL